MENTLKELKQEAKDKKESLLKLLLQKTTEKWKDMETMRGLKRFVEDIEYQIKAKEREIEDLEDKKLTIIKNADFTSTSNRLAFIKNIDDIDIKIIDAKDAISRLQAFSKEYF